MRKTSDAGEPEWEKGGNALRHLLGLSQSGLGKRLDASAMAVSRWERGVQEPPANLAD